MAWKAQCTVTDVNSTLLTASGPATGTDDDVNVSTVTVNVYTTSQSHLDVGSVITVESDC